MKKILLALAALAFVACNEEKKAAPAAKTPQVAPKPPAPHYEMQGMGFLQYDHSLPLQGISDPALSLTQMAGKPNMIYYFSATCPHCQQTYPKFAKLVEKYKDQFNIYAVASPRNTPAQIDEFVKNQNVQLPLFQDKKIAYSKTYGVGTVPLVILTNQHGNYLRYKSWDRQVEDFAKEADKIVKEISK